MQPLATTHKQGAHGGGRLLAFVRDSPPPSRSGLKAPKGGVFGGGGGGLAAEEGFSGGLPSR